VKTLICCAVLLCLPTLALANGLEPTITFLSTTVKESVVSWQIDWTSPPDFQTADQYNRQADSFQIYTFAAPVPVGGTFRYFEDFTSVIRGEELHTWGTLAVRALVPIDPDISLSGGWGTLRELDPITLTGRTLTFQTSLASLNVPTSTFGYGIETFHYGSQNSANYYCSSGTVCVPEPATFGFLATGLAALVGVRRWTI
jgi:hypothetical protein